MNTCTLVGRVVRDLELRYTSNGVPVTNFTLAVRRGKKDDGEEITDFHDCVAWRKTAELIAQYRGKGDELAVSGPMHKNKRDYNGETKTQVELVVQNFSLIGSLRSKGNNTERQNDYTPPPKPQNDGELPF